MISGLLLEGLLTERTVKHKFNPATLIFSRRGREEGREIGFQEWNHRVTGN